MQRSKIRYYLIAPLFILFIITSHCDAQWQQKEFIIGAYQGPYPIPIFKNGAVDTSSFIEQVQLAHKAGFNFSTGSDGPSSNLTYQNIKSDLYSRYGIKSLYLSPLFGQSIMSNDATAALNAYQFTKSLDSSSQDVFYGYNLIDEPPIRGSEEVLQWVKYLKDVDPSKLVFVNLLPIYAFNNNAEKYKQYLQSYLDTTGVARLDVVCYDFYPFIGSGIRPLYFYNLKQITQMAYGRPVWDYVLSTPHWVYPQPNQYMLNFMVFCPLAYGVKGILYFTYQTIGYNPSLQYQFGPAIIDTAGNPTQLYDLVSPLNHFVADVVGPVEMASNCLGTYHVSNTTWDQVLSPDEIVNENMPLLAGISNKNMLVGIFQNKKDSQRFNLFLVNKADKDLQNVYIALKGNYVGQVQISVSYLTNDTSNTDLYEPVNSFYDIESNETWFYANFAPGEGRMVRVDSVSKPYQKIFITPKINLGVYPNPSFGDLRIRYSLPVNSNVRMQVFDSGGRLLRTIQNTAYLTRGVYHQVADLTGLTPGIYFLSLFTPTLVSTKKIVLMRN